MNGSDFLSMFGGNGLDDDAPRDAKAAVRASLEGDRRRYYVDVSGDGTHYVCSGIRSGAGFSRCDVTLDGEGLVTVRANSVLVPENYIRDVGRLARVWNKRFIIDGFTIEDDRLMFVTDPFDPLDSKYECADVVGKALSTIHHFAGVVLALDAGVAPWDVLDLFDKKNDGPSDDDDSAPSEEEDPLAALIRMVRES